MEAYRAYSAGLIPIEAVPKVNLNATESTALRVIDFEILKQFAVDANDVSSSVRSDL